MFSLQKTIIGSSHGDPNHVKQYLRKAGAKRVDEVDRYVDAVYRLCQEDTMPDAAVIVAQFAHETDYARSDWWQSRLNPAGIGITGDPKQDAASKTFRDGEEAARAHVAHMLLYVYGKIDLGGLTAKDDPRYDAYVTAFGHQGLVSSLIHLGSGVWAADKDYATKLLRHMNEMFDSPTKETLNMKAYRFVGLSKDVWLPDDILVEINIVNNSHTRSYQKYTSQVKETWHDTGTNGSDAYGQSNWLHKYKTAGNISGFNFAADGVIRTRNGKTYRGLIIQLTPLDEVTWAAGTPEGNRISYHVEQCFGGANVWTNSLYVNAALHGGIAAAQNWNVNSALVKHQYWYGKFCPAQILSRGIWNDVVQMVKDAQVRAQIAAKGGAVEVPIPVPSEYGKPSPVMVDGKKWMGEKDVTVNNVQFFEDPRTVTTIDGNVNIRVYASTQSLNTGPAVKPNTPVEVVGWCRGEKVGDEDRWWITSYSHSRMWVGGTVEKPEDANKPVEEPLPDTDGVFRVVNGQVYYPVNIGEIETENDAKLYKYADLDSPVVGEIAAKTKIRPEYWCLGDKQEDEVVWWILEDKEGRDAIAHGARIHVTDTMVRPD